MGRVHCAICEIGLLQVYTQYRSKDTQYIFKGTVSGLKRILAIWFDISSTPQGINN